MSKYNTGRFKCFSQFNDELVLKKIKYEIRKP